MLSGFRLSEAWQYKAPFLMSIVYFFLFTGSARFPDAMRATLCSLCTIGGIAGIGYLSNDIADREADRKSGSPNATLHLRSRSVLLLFALLGAAALLPWLVFVKPDRVWMALLGSEFLLFFAYAVPPFRFKERGFLGLLTDALYAHANPALLAVYTMYAATGRRYPHAPLLFTSVGVWQLLVGLRNILQHEIRDVADDRAAGTQTWVTQIGERAAEGLIGAVFLPAEVFAFLVWILTESLAIPALSFTFAVHTIATALVIRRYAGKIMNQPLWELILLFLDDFFVVWVPLVILVSICLTNWSMIVLLLLHVVVFQDRLFPVFRFWMRFLRDSWMGTDLRETLTKCSASAEVPLSQVRR